MGPLQADRLAEQLEIPETTVLLRGTRKMAEPAFTAVWEAAERRLLVGEVNARGLDCSFDNGSRLRRIGYEESDLKGYFQPIVVDL